MVYAKSFALGENSSSITKYPNINIDKLFNIKIILAILFL